MIASCILSKKAKFQVTNPKKNNTTNTINTIINGFELFLAFLPVLFSNSNIESSLSFSLSGNFKVNNTVSVDAITKNANLTQI